MKRIVDQYLLEWKQSARRHPLIIRGARQIGKTYAIRMLGKTYKNFVEINFEERPDLISIFDLNLVSERIIKELSDQLQTPINSSDTLLFFDEIQNAPKAITALRYFYETMPELHVIAAGSLLDFAIQQVGMPVGRVESLYMYPASFLEFLWAINEHSLAQDIAHTTSSVPMEESTHKKILALVGQYIAIGGMPAAIMQWNETKNLGDCAKIHAKILDSYRNDFNKYAKAHQLKYLNDLFKFVPQNLGSRFKYESVPGQYRKQDLMPCLDLLEMAGVMHRVVHSSGQKIPVGALANHDLFKVIFLDVALSSAALDLNMGVWLTDPLEQLANKGGIVEAFVGQELLAYGHHIKKSDYIQMPYGLRFSAQNFSIHEKVHSYPLYAVAQVVR